MKKYLLGDKLSNWIATPLNIWYKILKDSKCERNARLLRWVALDTEFTPTMLDSRFTRRTNLDITSYCKISTNADIVSFMDLREKHNFEKQDLFRYFQLRDYFNKK